MENEKSESEKFKFELIYEVYDEKIDITEERAFECIFAAPNAKKRGALARIDARKAKEIYMLGLDHPLVLEAQNMEDDIDHETKDDAARSGIAFAELEALKNDDVDRILREHRDAIARAIDPIVTKSATDKRRERFGEDVTKVTYDSYLFAEGQQKIEDNTMLRVAQCAVRESVLPVAFRELVESDVTSEFWQLQHWEVMREVVRRFRLACDKGRRSHFENTKITNISSATAGIQTGNGTPGSETAKNGISDVASAPA